MPKVKTPQDLVRKTKESLDKLLADEKKALDELHKNLTQMKVVLYGTGDAEPSSDQIAALSVEVCQSNLLLLFVKALPKADFEASKDMVQIFTKILRREVGTRFPTVDHIVGKPDVLVALVEGYNDPETALNSGNLLRECIRHEALAKIILHKPDLFYKFFGFVQVGAFDIASDAFSTFKDLLTKHKIACADFLEKNYDEVFGRYVQLLNSENYVTRRQSLKLLGELLLDRTNFSIMTKYISNPENLKLMMNMLRDKSKNIQFEAFHVFKVFVANPSKSQPIMDILLKNRERLVKFLDDFHQDRAEDEQFMDEKKYLIKQIREL
eukprot:m.478977 g.478977  ORF g.478977 m.478977 type:complete len:324 (-) comp21290_c0_seq1:212-1183(-)